MSGTHQVINSTKTNKDFSLHHSMDAGQSYTSRTIVHAKLEMTEPGDHDEQEADTVANTIAAGGKIRRKISCGSGSSGITVSNQMESQLNHLRGGGQAMPTGLRNMMESGFGQDFSHVRLHTDSEAATLSSSIHAKAFTHGNDIYFNQGQFSPNTAEGQKLMAHELTHVVQGGGKIGRDGENPVSFNFHCDEHLKGGYCNLIDIYDVGLGIMADPKFSSDFLKETGYGISAIFPKSDSSLYVYFRPLDKGHGNSMGLSAGFKYPGIFSASTDFNFISKSNEIGAYADLTLPVSSYWGDKEWLKFNLWYKHNAEWYNSNWNGLSKTANNFNSNDFGFMITIDVSPFLTKNNHSEPTENDITITDVQTTITQGNTSASSSNPNSFQNPANIPPVKNTYPEWLNSVTKFITKGVLAYARSKKKELDEMDMKVKFY